MKIFFMVTILMIFSHTGFAGGSVENGGDMYRCSTSRLTPISMPGDQYLYFTYDYVEGLASDSPKSSYIENNLTWFEYEKRLLGILGLVAGDLYPSFLDFSKSIDRISLSQSEIRNRRWIPNSSILGWTFYGNQRLLPEECIEQENFFSVTRSVLRVEKSKNKKIEYRYDPVVMANIKSYMPLQFSMLMVHEWLWDHSKNGIKNRAANRFLHSREIDSMTRDEIIERLRSYEIIK